MSKAKIIKEAFKLAKKSYGKIKKAKSFSKGGVESAFKKAKVTPTNLGKITKSKATKGVESAGVVKNVAKAKAKGNAILAGTAAVVGASVAYNKNKAKKAAAKKPATKKSKAPVASAKKATVRIAPYEPKALVAKSKPRASSFKPTAKKTPAVTGKTKTKKAKTVRRRAGVASSSRSRR